MDMEKLTWYHHRLRGMSLSEIVYRLKHACFRRVDRLRATNGFSSDPPALTSKGMWLQPRQLKCLDRADRMDDAILIQDSENALLGKFDIFGIEADFGKPIDWHLDPKTQRRWPLVFWGDIDYRDGVRVGGAKFVWELNRLHHWPRLALAYALTGESRFLEGFLNQLEEWMEANPYPLGINWVSGIEMGIRLVNLFYALKAINPENLTVEDRRRVLSFVQVHGRHIYRYPSMHSSCANHAVAEALGLFVAGISCPELPEGLGWKAFGRQVLEREAMRQIQADGSSFEFSVSYLPFIVEQYLVYARVAADYGEPAMEHVDDRIGRACCFLQALMDGAGNLPLIGDDDDGFLLKPISRPVQPLFSLLSSAALHLERPELRPATSGFDEKILLLCGADAMVKLEFQATEPPPLKYCGFFPEAGLSVHRHREGEAEFLFVGNAGALGLPPLSGHGHADCLSFWLSVGGRPVFVDSGTYLYHSGGKWRRYFRSTRAHNTVIVDDMDQAEQLGNFIFGSPYRVSGLLWREMERGVEWHGCHDGYARLADPVIHRREVTLFRNPFFLRIRDRLECASCHRIAVLFHFHPEVRILEDSPGSFRILTPDISLTLRGDPRLKGEAIRGREDPQAGWYSPVFNRLEKSYTLNFSGTIEQTTTLVTEVGIT